ncbi:MAG: hypothetical protein Q8S73_16745 [Deltaproteobacteria bacterium]|nr:hypothetical protein [Myxococcales bacterium]MDP3215757.1 hypothetical protein [Deltaproteobacteria bacterium]
MQASPPGHVRPQAPQFSAFDATLTHRPPQAVWPSGQTIAQAPCTHDSLG